MQFSLRNYYKSAASLRNVSLKDTIKTVFDYISSENALNLYPNYPSPPNKAYMIFIRNNGYNLANCPQTVRDNFHVGNEAESARQEEKQESKKYILALEKFFSDNENFLFPAQVNHIKKRIRDMKNRVEVSVTILKLEF